MLPINLIYIESFQKNVPVDLKNKLEKMGYSFYQQDFSGDIQAIKMTNNKPEAVSDIRGRGKSIIIQ